MSRWGGRFGWVTMSYPTAMPPALSHPILYHVAPFYFISLFNAPPLQPRINFTSLCHALYPLRPTHQTTHPLSYSPFHPLPSPPIIPFTSLSLTVAFYLFPSLPIPSHLAPTVPLLFNTFPYPLQTFSYPFHALSIPFPYRPVLSHLFASLLTPSRPIPFYSFPLLPSPSSLPIHSSPSLTPSLSLSSPFRSRDFDVDYPLCSTTITRTRRRRIFAANRGLGIIRSHFRRTSAHEIPIS